jgi:hypothetical protein
LMGSTIFLFTYGNEDKCPCLVDLDPNKSSNCNSDHTCKKPDASQDKLKAE